MFSDHDWVNRLGIVHAVGWLLAMAGQVAILVLVLTVVRRNRSDAYRPLLLWSALHLGFTVVNTLSGVLVSLVASRGGVDEMLRAQFFQTCVSIVVGIGLVALLAHALVRLAQPPPSVVAESSPPYR